MDHKKMLAISKESTLKDFNITLEQLESSQNQYVESDKNFMIATYGNNALVRGTKELVIWCKERYKDFEPERILDGDEFFQLEERLRQYNKRLDGHHLMFLYHHDTNIKPVEGFTYKLYERNQFDELYQYKGYDMALSYKNDVDVMALVAFDGDKLAAIAGCDDRNKEIWQIGINTESAYREKGLATYLVYQLAQEILKREKAINYTTWGANIPSINVALNAGFKPVMTFYYATDIKKKE